MIEMRWIMKLGSYERVLQFRQQAYFAADKEANLRWSEWVEVSTIFIDG
jgi:hypothetical protein